MRPQIRIFDSAISPNKYSWEAVPFWTDAEDRVWYEVFVYLDGPDVPFVQKVTYTFPSFNRNTVHVQASSRNRQLATSLFTDVGGYIVYASALLRNGLEFRMSRRLQFHLELERDRDALTFKYQGIM